MASLRIGQSFQNTLRFGVCDQDAFDGVDRIGTEANGTIQGSKQILGRVGAEQCQYAAGLGLAAALVAEQTVEEAAGRRTQFGEAFAQERLLLVRIIAWSMDLADAPLPDDATREQTMPGDLGDRGAIDDHFALADPQWQRLADEPQRHRVIVLLIADEAFHVSDPINDCGRVIRMSGQRHQVRPFFGVAVDGPLLGLAMHMDIRNVGQPPGGDVVEMRQVAKGPAVEQVLLDEVKLPLVRGRLGKQAHGLKP